MYFNKIREKLIFKCDYITFCVAKKNGKFARARHCFFFVDKLSNKTYLNVVCALAASIHITYLFIRFTCSLVILITCAAAPSCRVAYIRRNHFTKRAHKNISIICNDLRAKQAHVLCELKFSGKCLYCCTTTTTLYTTGIATTRNTSYTYILHQ